VKLFGVQQQFKAEPKVVEPIEDYDIAEPAVQIEEDEGSEKPKEEEEPEEKQEEEAAAENEPEEADERDGVEEDHERCEESEHEDPTEELCFYDPNDIREIEVNSKNKATSLKKIILESIGLFKRANIILLKSSKEDNPEKINKGEINWVPFSDQDYETQVKFLANKTIAFKVYMDINVQVEGRGHSYRTSL
jgi:hypothetical protein